MRFLGLDFACLSVAEAAAVVASRPAGAPFGYVVTPNADHFVRLRAMPLLPGIYQRATLCLLDSRAVALIAGVFGLRAPPVVTGSDLAARLLERHIVPGERIGIIGLSPVWVPALMARHDLAPPAHFDPPLGFERDPVAIAAIVAFLKAHPVRLVFLAVGSPRQEILADILARTEGITGTGLCVGAALEFLCGARNRAPAWLSRCGLEWAWRLGREPRRLARRYLLDSPRIIALLWRQRLLMGRAQRRPRA